MAGRLSVERLHKQLYTRRLKKCVAKDLAMAQSRLRSDEFLKLSGKEKKRYLSKITLLSSIDPYTLKRSD